MVMMLMVTSVFVFQVNADGDSNIIKSNSDPIKICKIFYFDDWDPACQWSIRPEAMSDGIIEGDGHSASQYGDEEEGY